MLINIPSALPFNVSYIGRCTHEHRSVYARASVGVRTNIGRCTHEHRSVYDNIDDLLQKINRRLSDYQERVFGEMMDSIICRRRAV